MATIPAEQIWTSALNRAESIQAPFNHDKLIHYDTTLRDGERSRWACFHAAGEVRDRLQAGGNGCGARIESGFPAVSPEDTEAVKRILEAGLEAEIWGSPAACRRISTPTSNSAQYLLMEISTSDVKMDLRFYRSRYSSGCKTPVQHAEERHQAGEFLRGGRHPQRPRFPAPGIQHGAGRRGG